MKGNLFLLLVIFLFAGSSIKAQKSSKQAANLLETGDSLYGNQEWAKAKENYIKYLIDSSHSAGVLAKLGYCNQKLGLYNEALVSYNKALANKPIPPIQNVILARLSRTYSLMNNMDSAETYLINSAARGYNNLPDIDSLPEFINVRASSQFTTIRQKIYNIIYPCNGEPRSHDFDFWIGDWDCYATGTEFLTGHSHIESMAGSCAILENFTSLQAYSGKSFNFYDTNTGKWEQQWVGSGGNGDRAHYYNGEYKNGAMHFTSETTKPNGAKVTSNFIFYNVDKNTVRQYLETSSDGGKTFTPSYDLTYRRKIIQ